MMNQWGNEPYNMMPPHMMGPGANMAPPALLPTPMTPMVPHGHEGMPPMAPPNFLLPEWTQSQGIPEGHGGPGPGTFIGPVVPNNVEIGPAAPNNAEVDLTNVEDGKSGSEQNRSRSSRDTRDPRDRRDTGDRDRDRRRARSPHGRSSRDRSDRSRSDRRERRGPPRWDNMKDNMPSHGGLGNNMMIPGNGMLPYGNMMQQAQMDMTNMQNMGHMQNMPNMMPGMNVMANMMPNMMSNMMDPSMLMMQQMPMNNMNGNQPIFITSGVLLPPIQNASMPSRRERPPGCRTIFVGGLPHEVGEDIIRDIFQRFGGIVDIKLHKQGVCHVRFEKMDLVEQSFYISGYRYKRHDQMENEATTIFVDYALNREDQTEFERNKRKRTPTPPRIEPYTTTLFSTLIDKIKSDTEFADAAPTLAGWLERGECNKKNANAFYSLIQASNNQVRRLYNEKMAIDEEYHSIKATLKDKFAHVIMQFEQVGKILTAAKMQRVSDHFSKQQRRNIEMWLKMTEDLENIKEEFNTAFEEEEPEEKGGKSVVIIKKYEELKVEHENLQYELEGYKNEAHLAKDEAERKFEKFKAHFIAQQALQQPGQQVYPPLPPPPTPMEPPLPIVKPPPPRSDNKPLLSTPVALSDAKLISVLTAFLLVHPLGASLDYLVSYVRSIIPTATEATVHNILQKYNDVFCRQTTGVGANIESKWTFVTYDLIKKSAMF